MLQKIEQPFVKSEAALLKMRAAARLAAQTLERVASFVRPGVSTNELDRLCHDFITANGGRAACLNYNAYPKSICTSVNQVVCHGIPDDTVLTDGDILNLDLVVELEGYHGDTSRMFAVGSISEASRRLLMAVKDCLYAGIEAVKPGHSLDNVGAAIEACADRYGYAVVREYCGHGIGTRMHEAPDVVHFGDAGSGVTMVPGMTFTIEPMINAGSRHVKLLRDGWTVVTCDGKLSAQAEHTILVTESGYEILTLRQDEHQT